MESQNNWINTEDEMPAIGQRFNAVVHGKVEYDCGAYTGRWSDDDRRKTMLIKGVTHWQSLLSLPGEKSERPYSKDQMEAKLREISDEFYSKVQMETKLRELYIAIAIKKIGETFSLPQWLKENLK